MTRIEFIKAVKKCKKVFGAVVLAEHGDPQYIQLVKSDILRNVSKFEEDYKASLTDNNILYIN